MAKHFMLPYNEKIWNSDLTDMGIEWVAGRVPEAPLEDIIRSALGGTSEGYSHQSSFTYPLNGGIQDLAMRVGAPIHNRIHFNHKVKHIEKKGERSFDVDGAFFDEVIFTAPLDKAPAIVSCMGQEAETAAKLLKHISVTTFLFGIEESEAKPYSWVYMPSPEDGPANRLTYLSNYSPNNAPAGKASILAEVTHNKPLKVDDDYVSDLRKHLCRAGFFKENSVTVQAYDKVEYGYIYFDIDFDRKRTKAISGLEKLGIHPLGRFGRYNYNNVDHCILEAKTVADKIHEAWKK